MIHFLFSSMVAFSHTGLRDRQRKNGAGHVVSWWIAGVALTTVLLLVGGGLACGPDSSNGQDGGNWLDGGRDGDLVDAGGDAGQQMTCSAETCPDGCCQQGRCVDVSDKTCGRGGVTCTDCAAVGLACDLETYQCCSLASCHKIGVERGDLVFHGEPITTPGVLGYPQQMRILFFETLARDVGLYDAFWGPDVFTWDDRVMATGHRTVWTGIDVVAHKGVMDLQANGDVVVIRPTESMRQDVDLDAMVDRFSSFSSARVEPLPGLFLRWTQWGLNEIDWFTPTLANHWRQLHGIDVASLPVPRRFQPSADLSEDVYTDIDSSEFWARNVTAGSRLAWAIVWGMRQMQGQDVRQHFFHDLDMVAAIDTAYPGLVAWWLLEKGWGKPVTSEVSVEVFVRSEGARDWAGSALAKVPFALDIEARIEGQLTGVTVSVACDASGSPVSTQTADLPTHITLDASCLYQQSGWYAPTIRVERDGQTVAIGKAIAVATPHARSVHRGDIALWASPAVLPSDEGYQTQVYLASVESMGLEAGVYDSFWGEDLETWDDTDAVVGQRAFWGHVQYMNSTEDYPIPDGFDIVVFRPTETMRQAVDVDAAVSQTVTGTYSQPLWGVFLAWLDWARSNESWLSSNPGLFAQWQTLWGMDLQTACPPIDFDYSPALGSLGHTDLDSALFWARDMDCSSLAAWQTIWGWYVSGGEDVRQVFLNHHDVVGAVDAIAPAQMGWWLDNAGYVHRP